MNPFLLTKFVSIIRRPMKNKYLLITLLAGLTTLTGCFHYAPSTVKYNGVTYKTNWYQYSKDGRDLYPIGLLPPDEEPLFVKRHYEFWSTDAYTFDILYAEYEDSQFWHPHVYIAKEKIEEAQSFYQNKANYNYYLSLRFKEDKDVLIENEEEKAVMDVAIDAIMKNKKPTKTISTQETPHILNLSCFRKSKDGLFKTTEENLIVYDETIYYLKESNGATDTWTSYDLGEAGKTLYQMFVSYNLI